MFIRGHGMHQGKGSKRDTHKTGIWGFGILASGLSVQLFVCVCGSFTSEIPCTQYANLPLATAGFFLGLL